MRRNGRSQQTVHPSALQGRDCESISTYGEDERRNLQTTYGPGAGTLAQGRRGGICRTAKAYIRLLTIATTDGLKRTF